MNVIDKMRWVLNAQIRLLGFVLVLVMVMVVSSSRSVDAQQPQAHMSPIAAPAVAATVPWETTSIKFDQLGKQEQFGQTYKQMLSVLSGSGSLAFQNETDSDYARIQRYQFTLHKMQETIQEGLNFLQTTASPSNPSVQTDLVYRRDVARKILAYMAMYYQWQAPLFSLCSIHATGRACQTIQASLDRQRFLVSSDLGYFLQGELRYAGVSTVFFEIWPLPASVRDPNSHQVEIAFSSESKHNLFLAPFLVEPSNATAHDAVRRKALSSLLSSLAYVQAHLAPEERRAPNLSARPGPDRALYEESLSRQLITISEGKNRDLFFQEILSPTLVQILNVMRSTEFRQAITEKLRIRVIEVLTGACERDQLGGRLASMAHSFAQINASERLRRAQALARNQLVQEGGAYLDSNVMTREQVLVYMQQNIRTRTQEILRTLPTMAATGACRLLMQNYWAPRPAQQCAIGVGASGAPGSALVTGDRAHAVANFLGRGAPQTSQGAACAPGGQTQGEAWFRVDRLLSNLLEQVASDVKMKLKDAPQPWTRLGLADWTNLILGQISQTGALLFKQDIQCHLKDSAGSQSQCQGGHRNPQVYTSQNGWSERLLGEFEANNYKLFRDLLQIKHPLFAQMKFPENDSLDLRQKIFAQRSRFRTVYDLAVSAYLYRRATERKLALSSRPLNPNTSDESGSDVLLVTQNGPGPFDPAVVGEEVDPTRLLLAALRSEIDANANDVQVTWLVDYATSQVSRYMASRWTLMPVLQTGGIFSSGSARYLQLRVAPRESQEDHSQTSNRLQVLDNAVNTASDEAQQAIAHVGGSQFRLEYLPDRVEASMDRILSLLEVPQDELEAIRVSASQLARQRDQNCQGLIQSFICLPGNISSVYTILMNRDNRELVQLSGDRFANHSAPRNSAGNLLTHALGSLGERDTVQSRMKQLKRRLESGASIQGLAQGTPARELFDQLVQLFELSQNFTGSGSLAERVSLFVRAITADSSQHPKIFLAPFLQTKAEIERYRGLLANPTGHFMSLFNAMVALETHMRSLTSGGNAQQNLAQAVRGLSETNTLEELATQTLLRRDIHMAYLDNMLKKHMSDNPGLVMTFSVSPQQRGDSRIERLEFWQILESLREAVMSPGSALLNQVQTYNVERSLGQGVNAQQSPFQQFHVLNYFAQTEGSGGAQNVEGQELTAQGLLQSVLAEARTKIVPGHRAFSEDQGLSTFIRQYFDRYLNMYQDGASLESILGSGNRSGVPKRSDFYMFPVTLNISDMKLFCPEIRGQLSHETVLTESVGQCINKNLAYFAIGAHVFKPVLQRVQDQTLRLIQTVADPSHDVLADFYDAKVGEGMPSSRVTDVLGSTSEFFFDQYAQRQTHDAESIHSHFEQINSALFNFFQFDFMFQATQAMPVLHKVFNLSMYGGAMAGGVIQWMNGAQALHRLKVISPYTHAGLSRYSMLTPVNQQEFLGRVQESRQGLAHEIPNLLFWSGSEVMGVFQPRSDERWFNEGARAHGGGWTENRVRLAAFRMGLDPHGVIDGHVNFERAAEHIHRRIFGLRYNIYRDTTQWGARASGDGAHGEGSMFSVLNQDAQVLFDFYSRGADGVDQIQRSLLVMSQGASTAIDELNQRVTASSSRSLPVGQFYLYSDGNDEARPTQNIWGPGPQDQHNMMIPGVGGQFQYWPYTNFALRYRGNLPFGNEGHRTDRANISHGGALLGDPEALATLGYYQTFGDQEPPVSVRGQEQGRVRSPVFIFQRRTSPGDSRVQPGPQTGRSAPILETATTGSTATPGSSASPSRLRTRLRPSAGSVHDYPSGDGSTSGGHEGGGSTP